MDSYKFDKLQVKKANPIFKHHQLRKVANFFRFLEMCVVLVLISRLSIQLPVAFKNYSEYFGDFSVFMVSPRFVFLIGNVIIITLFAQSGQFSAHGSARNCSEHELYLQFIENITVNQTIDGAKMKYQEKQSKRIEESKEKQSIDGDHITYPEKRSLSTEDSIKSYKINGNLVKYPEKSSMKLNRETEKKQSMKPNREKEEKQSMKRGDTNICLEVTEYRRCNTEILIRFQSEKPRCVLQRCETENRRSIEPSTPEIERVANTSYPEDGMSNEEFRRTIEAFIARQQRLRRQEKCYTN